MKEALTFDDVLVVPKFSFIDSRKDVDLNTWLTNKIYGLPVISANMDTVTSVEMVNAMTDAGATGCLHRFHSIGDNVNMFLACKQRPMVSVGLGGLELERSEALKHAGASTFIIDVAHGAQMSVVKQANEMRRLLGDGVSIIVGNFASKDSVKTFLEYCSDSNVVNGFKVGIGPGSACTTRVMTGIGYPQLSAVIEIADLLKKTNKVTIADGGMKTPGDICKALAAGAQMVMLGGMLAGTDETPGEIYHEVWDSMAAIVDTVSDTIVSSFRDRYDIKKTFKKYRGSASQESYDVQGKSGTHRTAEGESFLVPYKGSVAKVLKDIEGGLRSSMTYVGARNLKEYRENAELVKISAAGYIEGTPHGKKGK